MDINFLDISYYMTFLGLGLAVLSSFQFPLIAPAIVIASIIGGFYGGLYEVEALGVLGALYFFAFVTPQVKQKWLAWVMHIAFIGICIGLGAHKMPGFNSMLILEQVQNSPISSPYNLMLHVDKIHVFFSVLVLMKHILVFPPLTNRQIQYVLLTLFALGLIQYGTVALNLMSIDYTTPKWLPIWALANLFFTCAAEELFFRGYMMNLCKVVMKPLYAILLTSLIFGAVHYPLGITFVIFGTLAGIGYAVVYHLSARIHWAIMTHFLFNLSHFVFYTYPTPL